MSKKLLAGVALCLMAAGVTAQVSPRDAEPTVPELKTIVEYQRKQISDLTIEVDRLKQQLAGTSQQASRPSQGLPSTTMAKRNLVANGDFELPKVATGHDFDMFQPNQNMGGWMVTENWVDLVAAKAGRPASGAQSVDLSGARPGTISQEIATVPGTIYEVRFAM